MDFGVSRELTEDQTMTAEIGTISWIAPEVLRGERYSEKADVYLFGVIMSELDNCRRPYSEGVPTDDNRGGNVKHTNARIAMLVNAGKLKPSLSPDCPISVRDRD
ncbi:TKL protein kinase [Phytophthora palmivora]|uniref:TKL protein kinase n=1 Tax=Phytophthora palmivora TaxID=4796 RepID=A0A2P4XWT5_9STRA|nr:TKL protein kinase [Phytophthora palmivora]